ATRARLALGFFREQVSVPGSYVRVAGGNGISVRKPRVGEGIVRVGGNGLLKQINALLNCFVRAPVAELACFQLKTVRLRVRRAGATQALLLLATELAAQMSRNVAGYV